MVKTRVVETAIDQEGNSYIFSDKNQEGWGLPGHVITDLFYHSTTTIDYVVVVQGTY